MWWRSPFGFKPGETAIGLLLVVCLAAGGWLLEWLLIQTAVLLTQFQSAASSSSELHRIEEIRLSLRRQLDANADWMIGSLLTLATMYSAWIVFKYVLSWYRSCKTIARPLDSWPVTIGICGVAIFGPLMLAWMSYVL